MIDAHATFLPSPFHWDGREGHVPRWLIIHGTAGGTSAQAIATWFQNPQAQASTNYIIGQDGTIVCSVLEENAAWANGALTAGHNAFWDVLNSVNPNLMTLSIEHVKAHTDNSDVLTEAQKAASFGLVQRLCERWHIPMRPADANGGICGHDSIDPVNRSGCPGPYPYAELYAFLNPVTPTTSTHTTIQENEPMPLQPLTLVQASGFYVQDGAMWKCKYAYNPSTGAMEPSPNGAVLGNAMLARYQTIGGEDLMGLTLLGLCITNEMRIGSQGETAQVFENGILVYDPQHHLDSRPGSTQPVYLAHLFTGAGLQILKNALARLLAATPAPTPTPTTPVVPDPQIVLLQAKVDELTKELNAQPIAPLQAEIAGLKATLAHIEQEAGQASAA